MSETLIMPSMTSVTSPVVVTGASGFIATHLIEQLLSMGYFVRGTVRSAPDTYTVLHELAGASERLELVRADLLDEAAFDEVVQGATVVLHTASPYAVSVEDPQRDLVDPAVEGTLHVLRACERAKTVERVVLTSSMAAITDEPDSSHVYTEADWNERSSLQRNPYYYSKTLAEKAAWEFVEKQGGFELVVINPFLVIGPCHTARMNPSNQVLADILGGVYPGIMNISWGFVDVRDVARAHIEAMERGDASGRYLCANETLSMRELVEKMRALGYARGYKLPRWSMDNALGNLSVKLGSYFQPSGVGSYLRTHIGREPRFDHAKIARDLDFSFLPLDDTIAATLTDLERWGHIPRRAS